MKLRKLSKCFVILFVLIVGVINIAIVLYNNAENAIFKNKCFVYEGYSYYSFPNYKDEENSGTVFFPIIDSKDVFSDFDVKKMKGTLSGENGSIKIDKFKISESGESKIYKSYILSCSFKIENDGVMVFDTLNIAGVGKFSIGTTIIENIVLDSRVKNKIGYCSNTEERNSYELFVEDVDIETSIDSVDIRDENNNIVSGTWVGDNKVSGKGEISEVRCKFPDKDYLYLKPIVRYSCQSKDYLESAKIATACKGEISKEEVEEYIRSKYNE